jgi:YYY domain-containing protein
MTDNLPTLEPNGQSDAPETATSQTSPTVTWDDLGRLAREGWSRLGRLSSDPRVATTLLVAILLLGVVLRFTGLNWDEHQHLHPDERFLTMVENSLEWPQSLKEYWDTAVNPLNPYNRGHGTYVYGLFPVVVAKFFAQLTGKMGYDGVYLVGRAMNGFLDLLCVLLVYHLGRRLYDVRVGLVGALLLALSVLNIQQAHFFTVDTTTTFFVTLALYLAVRVAQGGKTGALVLLGAAFGLAVSSKISVLSFLLIIGLALLLRLFGTAKEEGNGETPLSQWRGRFGRLRLRLTVEEDTSCGPASRAERMAPQLLWAAAGLLLVVLVALFVFRIAQPQAFEGPGFMGLKLNPKWKENMDYIAKLVSGEIDYPPSHQWTNRPIWFMLQNMVLWGQGLPWGLATWAGWAVMAWEMLRKRKWAHLLPWVWLSFTFGYQSIQFVKVTRYLLPSYPAAALIAGYGLIWLWDRARQPGHWAWWRRVAPAASTVILAAVVLGTAFWAFAFTSIYTRPVSRIAASRWMYANLPQGTTLSFELWDDPLPLNVDGRLASAEFRQIQMEPYWEDDANKRDKMYEWLGQVEYVVLSSNRLYQSIPRLPSRFPMTTRYYEALFSGELGFDLVRTFTARPRLLGIEIPDDNADESFTVYDHPKVLIFRKRADFDLAKVHALFDSYPLDRIVRVKPKQVTTAPNNLMLSDDMAAIQRAGGTWSSMFARDSLANRWPTLCWALALLLLGLVAFPFGFLAFSSLRDRGYALSKTLGLLLLGYLAWLLPGLRLAPFTRWLILGVLLALAAVSAVVAWRQWGGMRQFLRARWRLIVASELLFWGFFLVFWLIRWGNPDLWHPVMGGEKPMDLAYLNAIIKSSYFPPYDPWFSGGYLNYYYFGWVMTATLIKLTAIVPTVAYNLAIPTFFAMVAMGASCVVYNLVPDNGDEGGWLPRALRFGVVGALFVAVVGNLGEVRLLLQGLQELGQSVSFSSTIPGLPRLVQTVAGLWQLVVKGRELPFRAEWWYWNASRIMHYGEINEFPFFTFLYADLHAHLTAMPFATLALGLATSLVSGTKRVVREAALAVEEQEATLRTWLYRATERLRTCDWGLWLRLSLLGLVVGELWCNNSWDYPTYMVVSLLAITFGLYAELRPQGRGAPGRGAPGRDPWTWQALGQLALRGGFVVVVSMLLFRPYHANFGLAYSSIEKWQGERTPLGDYLLIHGTWLFILATWLLAIALRRGSRSAIVRATRLFVAPAAKRQRALPLYLALVRCQTMGYELAWLGIAFLGLLLAAFILTKAWVLLLGVPIAVLAATLVFARDTSAGQRLLRSLVALGMVLTLAVEYIVLKGDIGRMNTVFKFYLQVWFLWGIASAVALEQLSPRLAAWRPAGARLWRTALTLLLIGVALYPLGASYGKVRDRWDRSLPGGLDGTLYMTTAHYQDNGQDLPLENDRQAIVWLQDHVVGSPVIAEANTPLYRWGSRISIYTGLPSIIGWDWHQKQQRAAVDGIVVDWRLQDLRDLYNTIEVDLAQQILDRYHVGYVYVGDLERAYYDAQGLAKFEQMVGSSLDVVYRQQGVTIYRVRHSGAREIAMAASPRRAGLQDWLARHWVPSVVQAQGPEKEPSGNLVAPPQTEVDLLLDTPVEQLPVEPGRGWNRWLAGSTVGLALFWWFVLLVVGWAAWPLAARVFPGLADRGYGLAKGLGLLLVGYTVWLGSSLRLLSNSPPVAWGALLLLGACSFFLWRRQPASLSAVWADPQGRKLLLLEEALFSVALAVFVGIRVLNPDLWQPWFGGEKMMEIAFLNAISRSAHMPPYDPYFAGGYINYYYYGQFLTSLLGKLVGSAPEITFNLAVPTFFALTVAHVFTLARELSARLARPGDGPAVTDAAAGLAGGFAGVLLVAVIGNLTGLTQFVARLGAIGGAQGAGWADLSAYGRGLVQVLNGQAGLPAFDYWYAGTRVIPYTINEFPLFSFLFADLHPHMMAIPFTVLALALCLALLDLRQAARDRTVGLARGRTALTWASIVICLGALGLINTWDLPTYWALMGCCVLYGGFRQGGVSGLARSGAVLLLMVLASLVVYAPFYAHYRAQYVGLAAVSAQDVSPLAPFMAIWALFLLVVVSVLVWWWRTSWPWRRLRRMAQRWGRRPLVRHLSAGHWRSWCWSTAASLLVLLLALALAATLAAQGRAVLALATPLVLIAAVLVLWSRDAAAFLARLLVLVGVAIWAGVELIYLQDFLAGGDWHRMNTVFKFYIQSWVILGIVGGALLPFLWRRVGSRGWGALWRGTAGFLLLSSLIYTINALPARVLERFPGENAPIGTLDGTAYMAVASYHWPTDEHEIVLAYDREAIAWLWQNVPGTPVLAEAVLGYYREGGLRVSSYTGLPTLVGMHEREQRPAQQVAQRESDVERLYDTEDAEEFWRLAQQYQVRYIYVGQLERAVYAGSGLAKFEQMAAQGSLAVVYRNPQVVIYRVPADGEA